MAVLKHGLDYGFGPTLQLLLDYYESLTQVLLGWAEPYLKDTLADLRDLVGWDLKLYPHWKHIFVLMMVYFSARLRSAWAVGERTSAAFLWVTGLVWAFLSSVAAGSVPIMPGTRTTTSMLVAIFPVIGVFLFDLSENVWTSVLRRDVQAKLEGDEKFTRLEVFRKLARKASLRFLVACFIILMAVQIMELPVFKDVSNPGLVVLGLLVIAMSFYWLYQGTLATPHRQRPGESWLQAYLRTGSTRVGLIILATVSGAILFVLINAGMKPLGL